MNTIYGGAISGGKEVDAFLAGDDDRAKALVAELLRSLGLRPLDAGGLEMAHALEWADDGGVLGRREPRRGRVGGSSTRDASS